jgi:hypothetical protein
MKNSFRIYLIVLVFPMTLNARVFNINEEKIATTVKGAWAPSSVLQSHFEDTSGTNITIEDEVNYNLGGEIGLVFTASRAAFRLGVESIHPNPIEAKEGTNLSNQIMYTFDSDISVLLPKADIDFTIRSGDAWRIFLSLGGGVGTLSYKNSYAMTTEGQTVFSGLANFSEEGTSTATMLEGGLNFEHLFTDTTTIVIELGYRQLKFEEVKFKNDVTSFTGAHVKGDIVLNADGTNKAIDFTGFVAGVCFRFYLGK